MSVRILTASRRVAAHYPAGPDSSFHWMRAPGTSHDGLHADDLSLVGCCLDGDGEALRLFEDRFMVPVRRMLGRRGFPGHELDDFIQGLRCSLLVGPSPRLSRYSGRGPLRRWLRILALRDAYRYRDPARSASDPLARQELARESAGRLFDPVYVRSRRDRRRLLEEALRAALRQMRPSDSAVLRASYIAGASLDEIAASDGVHRSTVARRLNRARERLLEAIRLRLAANGDDRSAAGVLGSWSSWLEISFRRLLLEAGEP